MTEDFLDKKLNKRAKDHSVRKLVFRPTDMIDFTSNDYLGIVKNGLIEQAVPSNLSHGSTGSRLLSGNYHLIEETENLIANFHNAEAALIFNSGYDANTGLLSCVPQKNDTIIYDQLSHSSLRDGIRLSFANAFSFFHNDLNYLEKKLKSAGKGGEKFVVTESIYSMDGDRAPLKQIADLCERFNAALIVDEAHATGIIGEKGEGLVQESFLEEKCFARIHTFGKACGVHGAAIVGSKKLRDYLINFSRQFIYSTSLPPASTQAIKISYETFPSMQEERNHLNELVKIFQSIKLRFKILESDTPIQPVVIPGNEEVKKVAEVCHQKNFDVRPILYPTVPEGQERLRIVLHSFNSETEIRSLLRVLG